MPQEKLWFFMISCFIPGQTGAQTGCALGDNQGLLRSSEVTLLRLFLYCVNTAPEGVCLICCAGVFDLLHTQTTDLDNAICTGTGPLINGSNEIPDIIVVVKVS